MGHPTRNISAKSEYVLRQQTGQKPAPLADQPGGSIREVMATMLVLALVGCCLAALCAWLISLILALS